MTTVRCPLTLTKLLERVLTLRPSLLWMNVTKLYLVCIPCLLEFNLIEIGKITTHKGFKIKQQNLTLSGLTDNLFVWE